MTTIPSLSAIGPRRSKRWGVGVVALFGLTTGCASAASDRTSASPSPRDESATPPDGPAAHGPFAWVRLHDVQGLSGGQAVYLRAEGASWAQVVTAAEHEGLDERRYTAELDPAQRSELRALLEETDFMSLSIPERLGIPDEARAVITVHLASGAEHTVAKWDSDPAHPRFDPVYRWLLDWATQVARTEAAYAGPWDPAWEPEGFPRAESR